MANISNNTYYHLQRDLLKTENQAEPQLESKNFISNAVKNSNINSLSSELCLYVFCKKIGINLKNNQLTFKTINYIEPNECVIMQSPDNQFKLLNLLRHVHVALNGYYNLMVFGMSVHDKISTVLSEIFYNKSISDIEELTELLYSIASDSSTQNPSHINNYQNIDHFLETSLLNLNHEVPIGISYLSEFLDDLFCRYSEVIKNCVKKPTSNWIFVTCNGNYKEHHPIKGRVNISFGNNTSGEIFEGAMIILAPIILEFCLSRENITKFKFIAPETIKNIHNRGHVSDGQITIYFTPETNADLILETLTILDAYLQKVLISKLQLFIIKPVPNAFDTFIPECVFTTFRNEYLLEWNDLYIDFTDFTKPIPFTLPNFLEHYNEAKNKDCIPHKFSKYINMQFQYEASDEKTRYDFIRSIISAHDISIESKNEALLTQYIEIVKSFINNLNY